MIKKYKSPKIKSIQLDPKQALLQVCVIGGGIYVCIGGTSFCGYTVNSIGPPCDTAPKGHTATGQNMRPTSIGGAGSSATVAS